MSDTDSKIRTMMAEMPSAFKPEKAAGVDAVIQYNLTGEGGSSWWSKIADGACSVQEGTAESPTLTITMVASDYIDMMAGRLDAMAAFMQGKIKAEGDLMLGMRLMSFFS